MYEYSETTTESISEINSLVREELIFQYRAEWENGCEDEELMDSLLRVIQFYSNGAEWREFQRQIDNWNTDNEENSNAV